MKTVSILSSISGGMSQSSSQSDFINVYAPGPVYGLPYPVTYNGRTIFGDDSVSISGMSFTMSPKDRSWETCAYWMGSGCLVGGGISLLFSLCLRR